MEDFASSGTGSLVHLAGGKAVPVRGLDPAGLRRHLADGLDDRAMVPEPLANLETLAAALPEETADLEVAEEVETPDPAVAVAYNLRLALLDAVDDLLPLLGCGVLMDDYGALVRDVDGEDPRVAARGLVRELRGKIAAGHGLQSPAPQELDVLLQRIRGNIRAIGHHKNIREYPARGDR